MYGMKTLQKQMTMWMITLVSIFAFTSCDEDWWNNWDVRHELPGRWEIKEVSGWNNCPYRRGDTWRFYNDGIFVSNGSQGFHEEGYWQFYGQEITFTFDGQTSMRAYVRNFDYDYMTLDVTDYYYNTSYTLRLAKSY